MADEIIDILHNITYQVHDQELQKAVTNVEKNISAVNNLTQRQIKLAQMYDRTQADDEKRRRRILSLIGQTNSKIKDHSRNLERTVVSNKALNRAMESEIGIINNLENKLKILHQARRNATSDSEVRRYSQMISREQSRVNQLTNVSGQRGGLGGILGAGGLGSVSRLIPAIGGALSLGAISSQIKDVTQKFESYRTVLRNTFQSSVKANEEFEKIKDFAEKTPYAVDELMGSFVKLVNRGFVPTKEELTNLGDLAASQGKSFDQLTEAILDAQTGEFERLKEFGVRAKTTGDTVTLSFKGIEKQVKKTDEQALRNAVISFGKLQGVAGGMAAQATTLSGKISNLGDSFDSLFASIGEQGKGVFGDLIDGAKELVDWFGEMVKTSPVDSLREQQAELNNLVGALMIANDNEEMRSYLMSEISAKYPEFLNLIGSEKTSIEQLSSALEILNKQYDLRIRKQLSQERIDKANEKKKELFEQQDQAINSLMPELQKRGYTVASFSSLSTDEKQLVGQQILDEKTAEYTKLQQLYQNETAQGSAKLIIRDKLKWAKEDAEAWSQFLEIQKDLNEEIAGEFKLQAAYDESHKKDLLNLLKEAEEKLQQLKKENADKGLIATQESIIQGIKNELNPPTPNQTKNTPGDKTTKGKKTDPNAEALKQLDDQMKAEQEKLKQRFEAERKLLLEALEQETIDREVYGSRLQVLTDELNAGLLNVEADYAARRIKFLKGAEKEATKTRIAEIGNSLKDITDAIKQRSEKIIEQLIKEQKNIDDELFKLMADDEQKELRNLERSTQSQIDSITEQFNKLRTLQQNALSDINSGDPTREQSGQEEMERIVQNQQELERLSQKITEDSEKKKRDIRLKYALLEITELEKLATQKIDIYTESEQKAFDEKYTQVLEENDRELNQLKDKNSEVIDETELSNKEKKKLDEKRAKESEEIAQRSEIAKLYILKTSIQNQLTVLRAGFDDLTTEEQEERAKQIASMEAQLGAVQNNIKSAVLQQDNGKEKKSGWQESFLNFYTELHNEISLATSAASTFIGILQSMVDQEIAIRERRVDRLQRIAERGNAELLQIEEERLQKAQAQQERYARQQIVINAIQTTSESILAVAKAANAGGGWGTIALVLATIGALASGFAMAKSLSQDSAPGFKGGVVDLDGPGTETSDSIHAKLSRGESVVTAAGTKAGDNAKILQMMNDGQGFSLPNIHHNSPNAIVKQNKDGDLHRIERKLDKLDGVIEAIHGIKSSSVSIDQEGLTAISNEINIRNNRRKKL